MYEIEYDSAVKDSMKKFPKHDLKAIFKKIDALRNEPRPSGVEPLQGSMKGYLRIRYGNYRIIYSVFDSKLIIYIVKVAKRGEVYRTP